MTSLPERSEGETRRTVTSCPVLPASELTPEKTRVLKHNDTFAVFNHRGDARPDEGGGHGIYRSGTRHLSALALSVEGRPPLLLSSTVTEDNSTLSVDLTNPIVEDERGVRLTADTLHLLRTTVLHDGVCYERVRVTNHGVAPVALRLTLELEADFADIFEVRGMHRLRRGTCWPPEATPTGVLFRYDGLDGVARRTRVTCAPAPATVVRNSLGYELELDPREGETLHISIACESDEPSLPHKPQRKGFAEARDAAASVVQRGLSSSCEVTSSNERFNAWMTRSFADLYMMVTQTEHGPYPYAGVPWYSTIFGRDGIITALEMLWVDPSIARGVLKTLAATQATEGSNADDAEPGKILHESRGGEMARLHEHAFARYYGTVDATPLFVMLAGEYLQRTGDIDTVRALWPNLDAALRWLDTHGDLDGDGFIEYARRSEHGLLQQGWKDSADSIFYADGRLVEPPVALCEVQGYAFGARVAGAHLAAATGNVMRSSQLMGKARHMKDRFERAFFCEEIGTYAIALDKDKRPCAVRASNAGHALFAGLASPEHARRAVETLMSPSLFSGWGIRTLAEGEARYNPMSYHNGSVWPHDNALIAAGMARYGYKQEALQLLSSLFDVSLNVELHRIPELFCGFVRRPRQGPTQYPVACAPQAWAAGAVLMMLQACLGLAIEAGDRRLRFDRPRLPAWMDWLRIRDLKVKDASVDLLLRRAGDGDAAIEVLDKRGQGDIEVVVTKWI